MHEPIFVSTFCLIMAYTGVQVVKHQLHRQLVSCFPALADMGAQSASSSPNKPLKFFTEPINSERILAHEQRQDPRRNGRYSVTDRLLRCAKIQAVGATNIGYACGVYFQLCVRSLTKCSWYIDYPSGTSGVNKLSIPVFYMCLRTCTLVAIRSRERTV